MQTMDEKADLVQKLLSWLYGEIQQEREWQNTPDANLQEVQDRFQFITRVSPAPYDHLTPCDLRAQTYRVNVEFSTYHHEHTSKPIFRVERLLSDIKKSKFCGQDGYQTVPFGLIINNLIENS